MRKRKTRDSGVRALDKLYREHMRYMDGVERRINKMLDKAQKQIAKNREAAIQAAEQ